MSNDHYQPRVEYPLSLREYYTSKQMLLFATDYATMQGVLWPELRADYTFPLDILFGDDGWRMGIHRAIKTPKFEDRLDRLSQDCTVTVRDAGFDP